MPMLFPILAVAVGAVAVGAVILYVVYKSVSGGNDKEE